MRGELTISQVTNSLEQDSLLPAIIFRSSRKLCDLDVEFAITNKKLHIHKNQQNLIKESIFKIIEKYDLDLELVKDHPHYQSLIFTGIGAHHAGQLLMWRLILEELMVAGSLRVLSATGTLAAGVDFPARTVVVTAHTRRGVDGYEKFTSSEFLQMSGRAGRRGKDLVGFCLVAPSRFCDARVVQKISNNPPEPLRSSYFPSPSTVLNLLKYRSVDGLRYTVERSLASFNDKKEAEHLKKLAEEDREKLSPKALKRLEQRLQESVGEDGDSEGLTKNEKKAVKRIYRFLKQSDELRVKQRSLLEKSLSGLNSLGYIENEGLSEKGNWASNLYTSMVIELAELISMFVDEGLLENLKMEELICIIAGICADPHRKYLTNTELVIDNDLVKKLNKTLNSIQSYAMPGVLETREFVSDAARTVLLWLKYSEWQSFRSILVLSGVSEGDAARLITQTAEQLGQIARLKDTHYELSLLATEAKFRLLRPPLTENIAIN